MIQNIEIGKRIKIRRQGLKISLRELARRTELTASFLSQVENGKANVSLDSLRRIAETMEVPLFYFLSETSENSSDPYQKSNSKEPIPESIQYIPVVRSAFRPKLYLPSSGVVYELLTPDMGRKMEAFSGKLAPGTGNIARKLREPTEEFVFVLSGTLFVGLDYGDFILNAGDSIYFEGERLRKLVCASEEEATWISVITPAVF